MPNDREEEPTQDEDIISTAIGDFGRWQLTFTFLLSLFNLTCTWHIYATTFQAQDIGFYCTMPPNLKELGEATWRNISHTPKDPKSKLDDNPCKIWDVNYEEYTPESIMGHDFESEGYKMRDCDSFTYEVLRPEESLISKWDLVCKKAHLRETMETVFLAGVAFGGIVSGFISDRFGRKKTLMASTLLQLVTGTLMAFTPWYQLYLVFKFILGFISVSVVFTGFVLCMELVGGKWRTISGVCYLFPVPLGYISSAGIAFFVRDATYNQLAISLPGLLLVSLYWILPESPRWLLTQGRVEENMEILKEATQVNKRILPRNMDKILKMKGGSVAEEEHHVGVVDLFRFPNIRRKSLILFVIWFSVYFGYYGSVMNMNNFGGDVYINTIISGSVEILSVLISIFILLKLGRRWPMCITMVSSGIVCTLTIALDSNQEKFKFALAMIARMLIASSNLILPVYTAELFPTVIRNLGVGACNVSGGAAMVLAPFLWQLDIILDGLPMVALGICATFGGIVALILPETAKQPMINTLEEGEEWGRQSRDRENAVATNAITGNFNKTFAE